MRNSALNPTSATSPPMPGVFPDYQAPIVRNGAAGRELATGRWGMPSSRPALMDATKKRGTKLEAKGKTVDFSQLRRMEPDSGTTNIRNVSSAHWKRWRSRASLPGAVHQLFRIRHHRGQAGAGVVAPDESRPLLAFAGLWADWTSVPASTPRRCR